MPTSASSQPEITTHEACSISSDILAASEEVRAILAGDCSATKNASTTETGSDGPTMLGYEGDMDVRAPRLNRLIALLSRSTIIADPVDFSTVQAGLLITVRITELGAPAGCRLKGELMSFLVGGDSEECSDEKPHQPYPIYSRRASFVKSLLGLRVGQSPKGKVLWQGRPVEVAICRIQRHAAASNAEDVVRSARDVLSQPATKRGRT